MTKFLDKCNRKETRPGAIYKLEFWKSVREREPDDWAKLILETGFSTGIKRWAASIVWFAYFRPSSEGALSDMVNGCPKISQLDPLAVVELLSEIGLKVEMMEDSE